MRVKLVTAYVPIPNHPRSPAEYGELGEKLGGVPVPKKAFYSRVENLWMWKLATRHPAPLQISAGDNPAKNSLAYHCVNHEKTTFLKTASDEDPSADVLVWVDYGIFHQPGITNQAIYEFCEKLNDKAIYIPGCWDKPEEISDAHPCWRFCGSVLACPKQYVDALDFAVRRQANFTVGKFNRVTWEVNTWARVEHWNRNLPIKWYKADHNETQFTGLELV